MPKSMWDAIGWSVGWKKRKAQLWVAYRHAPVFVGEHASVFSCNHASEVTIAKPIIANCLFNKVLSIQLDETIESLPRLETTIHILIKLWTCGGNDSDGDYDDECENKIALY